MVKKRKILQRAYDGSKNIRFGDFVTLLIAFGFTLERTSGSHQVFSHEKIPRPFPIQDVNGKAKPYQVKQLLKFVEEYGLKLEEEMDDEE